MPTPLADGIPVFCAHDEICATEAVTGNPRNPNMHPESQLTLLAKIIEAQGWRSPITVSRRSGFVVRGHGRLAAARLLGKTEVPVDWQDYEHEAAEWADLVADNRLAELAVLDMTALKDMLEEIDTGAFDLELTGFTSHELESLMTATYDGQSVEEDTPPEVDTENPPVTQPGDVWILGPHRLMCGDSTKAEDVAILMAGEQAACLLTDPPYNVDYVQGGLRARGGRGRKGANDGRTVPNDNQSPEDFQTFLRAIVRNCSEHLVAGGPYYVFHADAQRPAFQAALEAEGLEYRQTLIWAKDRFTLGRQDYHWRHEPILYGWKAGAAHAWFGEYNKDTVIEEERPASSDEHPTMKPLRLLARFIANSTQRGQLLLDPCGGSGSTLIAAGQLRRRCCMMEIDPRYCDVIVKRWERMTGDTAAREEGQPA